MQKGGFRWCIQSRHEVSNFVKILKVFGRICGKNTVRLSAVRCFIIVSLWIGKGRGGSGLWGDVRVWLSIGGGMAESDCQTNRN